jgi:hypothetical protein
MMIGIEIVGLPVAQGQLRLYHEASAVVGRWRAAVGASAPYARFVHEGTRRMAGRPFLAQALAAEKGPTAQRIIRATPKGAGAMSTALTDSERALAAAARRLAPVRTGRLRASVYSRIGGNR